MVVIGKQEWLINHYSSGYDQNRIEQIMDFFGVCVCVCVCVMTRSILARSNVGDFLIFFFLWNINLRGLFNAKAIPAED